MKDLRKIKNEDDLSTYIFSNTGCTMLEATDIAVKICSMHHKLGVFTGKSITMELYEYMAMSTNMYKLKERQAIQRLLEKNYSKFRFPFCHNRWTRAVERATKSYADNIYRYSKF